MALNRAIYKVYLIVYPMRGCHYMKTTYQMLCQH